MTASFDLAKLLLALEILVLRLKNGQAISPRNSSAK
jgi:hypothetical protein